MSELCRAVGRCRFAVGAFVPKGRAHSELGLYVVHVLLCTRFAVLRMNADTDLLLAAAADGVTSGDWLRCPCPYCLINRGKQDHKLSLAISRTSGWWRCFRCDEQGREPSLANPDLIAARAMRASVQQAPEDKTIDPPDEFCSLTGDAGTALVYRWARTYLESRDVSQYVWEAAGVGAVRTGYYAGRLIVPVMVAGKWRGWVARAARPKVPAPAYRYPKGMKRGDLLYNQDVLTLPAERPVYVVEGVFDALALWPDAVACLGKPSGNQKQILATARRPLVVALDGDAWRIGRGLAQYLQTYDVDATWIHLAPLTDPSSLGEDWLRNAERIAQ